MTINSPFIIAEIGLSHDGSLGMAYAMVDAVSEAGGDAIKFQTHIANSESTVEEKFRVNFSRQDSTRFDYWRRTEFTESEWLDLAQYCAEKGLTFMSTPFSIDAVHLLAKTGMRDWKIGSGEFYSRDILDVISDYGGNLYLSTGMSTLKEIDQQMTFLSKTNLDVVLMQCTSMYPTPLEKVGLNVLDQYKSLYDTKIGLSDHSGTIFPSLLCMAKGIDVLEVHVVLSKLQYGPDVKASIDIGEFKRMVEVRNAFATLNNNPVDKDLMSNELLELRELFTKSIATNADYSKGSVISNEMLSMKKPGSGIKYEHKDKLIGKYLKRDVKRNQLLKWDDIIL